MRVEFPAKTIPYVTGCSIVRSVLIGWLLIVSKCAVIVKLSTNAPSIFDSSKACVTPYIVGKTVYRKEHVKIVTFLILDCCFLLSLERFLCL